jgi:hypothetical protein
MMFQADEIAIAEFTEPVRDMFRHNMGMYIDFGKGHNGRVSDAGQRSFFLRT